ncbi:ABC transporter ATP-binding protein [Marinomonas sp. 15G1-11]|uniref:ABC transporter ATP-binding protein n=1 Tax=Marinomonas phaeophyticola TaxID=3004091 RepID=A0ABT4JYK5_9GAMM|nr:ABC transporter ATP-binding protein [Marinomonas sp. 15G1-11]MCZ2723152.1 ABC transporter ATP-binding protein [Marinomonas sp. 15G1-11]
MSKSKKISTLSLKEYWNQFSPFILPYKNLYLLGFLPIPISVFCSVAFPWLIIQIVDEQLVGQKWEGMGFWLLLISCVLVVNYIASSSYLYFVQKAALFSMRDMRLNMFDRVLNFPRSYFDKTPMGSVLTRLTSDLEAINESLASGVLAMVRDVLITVALLIFLSTISWQLTLVTLIIAPPIYWITTVLRRLLHESQLSSRRVLSQSTGYLQESLQGIKTVQLYNAEAETQKRFNLFTLAFYRFQSRSNLIDAGLFAIIEGITTISMGLIIWYGAHEILAAALSVGVLIGFIQTLDKIFVPIRDFTSQIASIQRALAALQNIQSLYDQPLETDNKEESLSQADMREMESQLESFNSLAFENVHFRYSESGSYVLKGVTFSLNKGDKIALVGSTGSGKSTILRLLTKTYREYEGSIRLNGVELRDIPKKLVNNFFSLMQQEVYLFSESIAFNIGLQREGITDAGIKEAAKYVYADEFIEKLPNGYQFILSANGSNLSAGQSQLVAFARAMASGSDLVLLDEATSSVDSVTENMIQRAIDHVFAEKTVIAIAHRLSTIQHSDQIIVLDQGEIIEKGTHESLIKEGGFYANLVESADE